MKSLSRFSIINDHFISLYQSYRFVSLNFITKNRLYIFQNFLLPLMSDILRPMQYFFLAFLSNVTHRFLCLHIDNVLPQTHVSEVLKMLALFRFTLQTGLLDQMKFRFLICLALSICLKKNKVNRLRGCLHEISFRVKLNISIRCLVDLL